MHRVYCAELPDPGTQIALEAREAEHLFKVFRSAPGERVVLLDCAGNSAEGVIVPGKKIEITAKRQHPEPGLKLHLCCALPRRQKLDQLLKQATELGAWAIRPLHCERSVAEGGPRERWDLLLREACKQSGNPFAPQLCEERTVAAALAELKALGCEIYYGSVLPAALPSGRSSAQGERAVLIGPEGGFSPDELKQIEEAGGIPLNFAPHILRLETAAVAALTVLRLLVIPVALLFLCGCERVSVEKNPLVIKAEKLRVSGDAAGARRFLRQAVARLPEEPGVYWHLARVCEEELNDPYEAAFCYRCFLQLARPDDPRRADAEKLSANAEAAIAGRALAASPEFARLQEQNKSLKKALLRQQQIINRQSMLLKQLQRPLPQGSGSSVKKEKRP